MIAKKTTIKKKVVSFKTYNEAMENLFPNVWKEEKKEDKKKVETMKDLASSILSHF